VYLIVAKEKENAYNVWVKAGSPQNWPTLDGVPAHIDSKGNIVPWFNPGEFGFKNFSQIASANIVPQQVDPSTGKRAQIELDEQSKAALKTEQDRASANLYYYGWLRDIQDSTKLSDQEKLAKYQELAQKYHMITTGQAEIKIRNADGRRVENPVLKISLKPGSL